MQPLHTRKIGGSSPSATTKRHWFYIVTLWLMVAVLIATGEILDCVTFVNVHETWCDNS